MTFSVRFFKRLILLILVLSIAIPTWLAIWFGAQTASLKRQLDEMGATPSSRPSQSQESPSQSGDPAVVPTSYDTQLNPEPLSYQTMFLELYSTAVIPAQRVKAIDTVYLTFDCTPSSNTLEILEKLDHYGVKATFFVTGSTDPDAAEIMREIVRQGHTIGLRSSSSSYQKIYQSVEDYLTDFNEIYNLVYEATGVRAEIFRFPGGSVNSYNSGIYQELIAEMLRRNFIFFDWTITEGSATKGELTAEEISANVVDKMAAEGRDRDIVKLQDSPGREMVAGALPSIIEELRAVGYSFQPLTANVLPVAFRYP